MSTQDEDLTQQEREEKLRAAAERKRKMNDAEKWDPAPGEVIQGEYIGKRHTTGFGKKTPVYYVDTWNSGIVSVLGRTMMVMEMDDEDAEPGDLISITFEGEQSAPDAEDDFYSYTVVTA
jgi:hypothetical protein